MSSGPSSEIAGPRVASRTIAAPARDVFDAWITPALVEDWWGPEGFSVKVHRLNAVAGGSFAFEMISPSGASCIMSGVYKTVEKPERLVFEVHEHCNLDLPDNTAPQTSHSVVTVAFDEYNGTTTVTISHSQLNEDYGLLAAASWSQSLDKLCRELRR